MQNTKIEGDDDNRIDKGDANHPGAKVRAQTRDVAALLKAAAGSSDYYLFAEDDMRLCPHGLVNI